ncbi:hypothetical protein ATN79_06270 [Paraburkholderia caribensis]|nr:hypothetical protein ATN79_06270 [Paraburkholderia caribensis]
MRLGGEHVFEITIDEMPALETMAPLGAKVLIPFDEAHNAPLDGTWSRIARMLSGKGATFLYSQIDAGVYRVLCTVPGADPHSQN